MRYDESVSSADINMSLPKPALFPLGRLVITPNAKNALQLANQTPEEFLDRHSSGDWGDLTPNDATANDEALAYNDQLLSAYDLAIGARIWVLTEGDRSVTTILLPSEN